MRYLLDSSVWLRSTLQANTVPLRLRRILEKPDEVFGLSIFSLWEAAKKHQKGKLRLPMDLGAWFTAALPEQVQVLPLTRTSLLSRRVCRNSRPAIQRTR